MLKDAAPYQYVGKPVERREARAKVTGRALYVDDIPTPGALWGKTVRSSLAKGRIKSIDFLPGVPWDEIVVAGASDLADNAVLLIMEDQPALCDKEVRHRHEAILLLAHEDIGIVEKAARLVRIDYEEEEPIFDMVRGEVMKEYAICHGDTEEEFAESDVVFERLYRTGAQEHVYIEPQGFIAEWKDGSVWVRGSHQCPYYVHKSLARAFGLRDGQVEVSQTTTGGAFGGKEDYPSNVAIHAALLAKKAGRPVRLIYDRQEDMAATTKRHPSEMRVRTGCMRDGRLRALEVDFRIDGGAYVTLSPVVLSRGLLHAFGPYNWPASRLVGKAHRTNSVPYGAFRGFGAPQSIFAIETHMTLLAEHLGMDPVEFRRKNFLRKGDAMPTGQIVDEDPRMAELMDRALEMSGYQEKKRAYRRGGGRGIGISTFMHGTGFTGSGEVYLNSIVALETREDGKLEVLVSSTEMGQGTETIFSQMAAEGAGISIEDVVFHQPETKFVPNSGPTVASRTCSIVGRLVQRASEEMRARLDGLSIQDHFAAHGKTRTEAAFEPPPGLVWDEENYKGSAYGAYSWSVDVAEVSIDPVTLAPRVESIWSTVDVGTVINPVLAEGQVHGGIAQAVGWAVCEDVKLKEGAMINGQMTNYIIPTSADAPNIEVEFCPAPWENGGYGSKGLGELPMDGPAPAIASAISMAVDGEITKIPVLPEDLLK